MNKIEELKQVSDALDAADAVIPYTGQLNNMARIEIDKARAILDRLSAPVGVKKIERLEEAVEFRRELVEFSIDRVKNFFGMNKDKPEISLDAVLWIAARAYLELQNAVSVGVPDGYVTVKKGFPFITGSEELVAVPVEFLMSDSSFDKLLSAASDGVLMVEYIPELRGALHGTLGNMMSPQEQARFLMVEYPKIIRKAAYNYLELQEKYKALKRQKGR